MTTTALAQQLQQTRPSRWAVDHHLRLGGRVWRLRAEVPELWALVEPVWGCLVTSGGDAVADFQIELRSRGDGAGVPAAPAEFDRWEWFEVDEVSTSPDGRLVCIEQPFGRTWVDRTSRTVVANLEPGKVTSRYWRGRPLLWPVVLLLLDDERTLVHAGLVSFEGRGVLLAGVSGSGKTTTSLACLRAGDGFAADDYCVVHLAGGAATGHALFASAWLDTDARVRFPDLGRDAIPPDGPDDPLEKHLITLSGRFGSNVVPDVDLAAICLPRVAQAERTVTRQVRPGEALRRLAPSSLLLPFGPGSVGLDRLGELVRRVPAYDIALSRDLDEVRGVLRDLVGT